MKPERVEEIISSYYNSDITFIKGQDQKAEYSEVRCMMYYFLKQFCYIDEVEIGKRFNRSHQYVINGLRNIDIFKTSPDKRQKFNHILKQILNEKPD